jgi:hypothetical protein
MAKTIGRNINFSDTATLSSAIVLNATTSTKVADAVELPNQLRINFTFTNNSSQDVWLKFQAASVDNDKKGILIFKRTVYEMPTDNVYHGEISAIADNGTPNVYVTEY